MTRHWVITDANGKIEEVRGPGVVGKQPTLEPGQSFEYTSACPLGTAFGTMHGTYQMRCAAVKSSTPRSRRSRSPPRTPFTRRLRAVGQRW